MRAQVRIDVQGRREVETFPRARVQRWAMTFSSRCVSPDRSVPLGQYWRNRPWVFSLVPRYQGL